VLDLVRAFGKQRWIKAMDQNNLSPNVDDVDEEYKTRLATMEFDLVPFLMGLEIDERETIVKAIPILAFGGNEIDVSMHTGIPAKEISAIFLKYPEVQEWRRRAVALKGEYFRRQLQYMTARSIQVLSGVLAEDWRNDESPSVRVGVLNAQVKVAMDMIHSVLPVIKEPEPVEVEEPKLSITNASARIVADEIMKIKAGDVSPSYAILKAHSDIDADDLTPQYGKMSLNFDTSSLLCHECGNWIKDNLYDHIGIHQLTPLEYVMKHGINGGLSFDEQTKY